MMSARGVLQSVGRFLLLVVLAGVAIEVYFVARVAAMVVWPAGSTTFERSEIVRIALTEHTLEWHQQWVPYAAISTTLKRAVIASEDDAFVSHGGVDWEALKGAWQRNEKAEDRVQRRIERAQRRHGDPAAVTPPKVVGGSTITQQLAKNLFLSGERTLLRKGQELVITFALEAFLSKQRILELYLNHAEWGQGVFGAEAAARHYYRLPASDLTRTQAATLAVMLPRPKYFESRPGSGYVSSRARVIAGRMAFARIP